MGIAAKLRAMAGMSTEEDKRRGEGGDQSNRGKRGKGINAELCRQGEKEYCTNGDIPTPTPGDGSRANQELRDAEKRAKKKGG